MSWFQNSRLFPIVFAFLAAACASKSLNDVKEFEQYNIRQATAKEAGQLKTCAQEILKEQKANYKANKRYFRKLTEMQADEACQDIYVHLMGNGKFFRALLLIHSSDSNVKWLLNEKGEITEYSDADVSDDIDL